MSEETELSHLRRKFRLAAFVNRHSRRGDFDLQTMEVDATPHADNRSFVYVSRVRSTHDVSPAAKFIFRRWNDVQTPVSRPRSSSPYSRTICARQSAWLLYAPQRAISRTAGPSQFRKTMHAPPPLRTSRHTASASCRVGRPMRAVYRSLVPKARLRSFRISGFSLFSGAGRDCTVDRASRHGSGESVRLLRTYPELKLV